MAEPQATASTPRTASARLLTMKFMQRGASTPASAPSRPATETASSSKRRKISASDVESLPANQLYDRGAIQAALDEEERKRQTAIEKQAAELGDSRWVLDVKGRGADSSLDDPKSSFNIVQVGFGEIDDSDPVDVGQPQRFRRFNMKRQRDSSEQGPDDDDESSSASSDDAERSRQHRQSPGSSTRKKSSSSDHLRRKQSRESIRAKEFANKRRNKDVKLNKLISISNAGSPSATQAAQANVVCYTCGQKGHIQSRCPAKRP